MLADNKRFSAWGREGGPFDIIAITMAVAVICGGFYLFNAASKEYRIAPVASTLPIVTPTMVPTPDKAPQQ
jgi:hypothetical protein